MKLLIYPLPVKVSLRDLRALFKGFGGFGGIALFGKKPSFEVVNKCLEDGSELRYAIVDIEPEKEARRAIKQLNRTHLGGAVVTVREFRFRAYSNERRALGWRNRPWSGSERRARERRKGEKTGEEIALGVVGFSHLTPPK